MDRLEADKAVCIDDGGTEHTLPLSLFSGTPSEGDVYSLTLMRDEEETAARRQRAQSLFDRLKRRT